MPRRVRVPEFAGQPLFSSPFVRALHFVVDKATYHKLYGYPWVE